MYTSIAFLVLQITLYHFSGLTDALGKAKDDQCSCPAPKNPAKPKSKPKADGPTCDVGEVCAPGDSGVCNAGYDGESACDQYCQNLYGNELLDAECVTRGPGVKQCVCKLKCCNQGCWGDPHCWTCDGNKFSYMGLPKHYLLKPCIPYTQLPNFEVRQSNKPWHGGPVSSLECIEVFVPEWETTVKITVPNVPDGPYEIKVNDTEICAPYHWSSLDGFEEHAVDIIYEDAEKGHLLLTTSFGLRVAISAHLFGKTAISDVSIDTPRHPDLKGKMCGLLGRWNDDISDETIDAAGTKQKTDNHFSCAFGNSWICPDTGVQPTCPESQKQSQEKQLQKINKLDDATKKKITDTCQTNLVQLADCLKSAGRPTYELNDCVTDCCALATASSDPNDRTNYVKALLKKHEHFCKKKLSPAKPTPPAKRKVGRTRTALAGNNDQQNAGTPTCDVGESEVDSAEGCCNAVGGDDGCRDYCSKKYGNELVGAECQNRDGGKKECICKLKCCNQGCWGDPHCWTCDGAKFSYQGLKKHCLLKPIDKYENYPNFEIRQTNRQYKDGPMSALESVELVIPEYELTIDITAPRQANDEYTVKINNNAQAVPYRWSRKKEFREEYVDFSYHDDQNKQIFIVTSFGLRIELTSHSSDDFASDINVYFPRHPDLKGKIQGLLGRWNDDINDESLDATGAKVTLDDKFSVAYGDSYIVVTETVKVPSPGECAKKQAQLEQKHEECVQKTDNHTKAIIKTMCEHTVQAVEGCCRQRGRPPPSSTCMANDLMQMKTQEEREDYCKARVEKASCTCKRKIEYNPPKCCPKKSPLYRLYSSKVDSYQYTADLQDVTKITDASSPAQYHMDGSDGQVASEANECSCNLKAVYHLCKECDGKEDHIYTTCKKEVDKLVKQNYKNEGIEFYCSPSPGKCDATVPLLRYTMGAMGHYYTTSEDQAKQYVIPHGGKAEGTLCYIWPSDRSPKKG